MHIYPLLIVNNFSIIVIGGVDMISDKNTITTIVIDKELKEKITKLAKKDRRSFSAYVSLLLENHLESVESPK